MKTITLEQIIQLHVLVIRHGGGSEGIRDLGRLESALATQTQEVFGEELYEGVFRKAAALMRGIIGDHPFVDGNKRTASLSALTLLEINGYKFEVPETALEDFAVQVAVEYLDVAAIALWLEQHTKKLR
jgi:death on curing protein